MIPARHSEAPSEESRANPAPERFFNHPSDAFVAGVVLLAAVVLMASPSCAEAASSAAAGSRARAAQ